uniref:serine--tRNA ligase n=1 Tax=Tetradesmus obliquus TaxID=3088 RepID=A0A383V6T7_TETOB|eukprot:jgi/Sobl393_1/16245/SZX60640.1
MLDINLFRTEKGGNPDIVRESQKRRYADVTLVDKVVQLDADWRTARFELDQVKKEFNALNKQIAELRKAKQDATELQDKTKAMKASIAELEEKEKQIISERDAALVPIGNLVHDSVPVDDNEDNNAIVREFGSPRSAGEGEKLYNHVDLVTLLDIVNLEAGAAVAGGRGFYLTNEGPLLNQALINAALHFAFRRGYKPVHTPFFMKQDIMAECAQLSQFDDELYKVTGEGDDKYLIATSEQTLCAMHRKGWFEKAELPLRLVGYSTCFRKEVGSHGRDTLGIFRIHQFEKVEQFVICSPEGDESWQVMEEMLGNAEDFYQALGLPYRVVNIVSGELNNAAAKKYDLEAWFPASKTFRELVSCSNCTDYQSRRLDIRMRQPKTAAGGEQKNAFVHMLNSTLSATERTLCCVLENYQTPDGVNVPPCLQPFLPGISFIPFRKIFDAKGKVVDRPKADIEAAVAAAAAAGASS